MKHIQSYVTLEGGKKIRLPLDHPELNDLDRLICALQCCGKLGRDDLGLLVKKQRELHRLDFLVSHRDPRLRPLPITAARPLFYDDHLRPLSPYCGIPEVECWAGWVARLKECALRIAKKVGFDAAEWDII